MASRISTIALEIAAVHGRRWITRLHRYAVVWRRGFVGRRGTSRFSTLTKNPAMRTTMATTNANDSAGTWRPTPTRPSAMSIAATRPRQRVSSMRWPANPSKRREQRERRGDGHRDDCGGADGEALHELHAHEQHAHQRDDDGRAREEHGTSGRVDGDADRLARVVPGVELLAIAGDDEERVVDADAEADHDPEERREVGDREDVGQQGDDRHADADAEQRVADGQPHREHRPEREDQDDDREREAEHLGRRRLERGEDLTAELDLHAVDVGRESLDLLADLVGAGERDLVGQLDVRERDLPGLRALQRDLRPGALHVGALDPHDVRDRGDLGEERLHLLLDLRVVDPLVGPEHDRADLPGALAAELVIEDVEAVPRLDVRKAELIAAR